MGKKSGEFLELLGYRYSVHDRMQYNKKYLLITSEA
jgi:hypothetical protein